MRVIYFNHLDDTQGVLSCQDTHIICVPRFCARFGWQQARYDEACVVKTCVSWAEGNTDEGTSRDIKHVGWIAGFERQVNQAKQARKESVPAFARDDDTRA